MFNTLTGSIAIIDSEMKSFIENFRCINKEEFNNYAKYITQLKEIGVLLDAEIEEVMLYRYLYNKQKYTYLHGSVLIITTYDCNFRCKYCYEGEIKTPKYMSEDTARLTCRWLEKLWEERGIQKIYVTYYGGEPLLNYKVIRSISRELSSWSKKNGKDFGTGIVTNGYLLSRGIVEEMLDNHFLENIHITLDGPRDIHDKRRPLKNGKGSFDKIIENIISISDIIRRPIIIRISVDKDNVKYIAELLEYLDELGLKQKVSIYFGSIYKFGKFPSYPYFMSDKELLKTVSFLYSIALKKGFNPIRDPSYNTMCTFHYDNHFIVGPEGYIYKCWDLINDVNYVCGNINDIRGKEHFDPESVFNNRFYEWTAFDPSSIEKCSNCALLPICHGGCRGRLIDSGKTLYSPDCSLPNIVTLEPTLREFVRIYYIKEVGAESI